ncbi:ligand-gated ion channel domain-containing protein [Phthorimaea operculella]|nr:ligand-gated ion channel domain-containing protein [Phthorimaea operculella]
MLVKVLCLLVCCLYCVSSEDELVIGGIFYEDEVPNLSDALNISASLFNLGSSEGVIGIIDGLGGKGTEHVQAICDRLELPHVILQPDELYNDEWSILNLYPSADAYNTILQEIITHKDWNNFTLLYEKGHSIKLMSSLLEMGNSTDPFYVSVRELSGDNYRDVLINAKEQGYTNFVVDCPSEKIHQLLTHAQQVGLMADEHSYIFLSPDVFTLDLTRFRYGGVNITGFRLLNMKPDSDLWKFCEEYNNSIEAVEAQDLKTKVVLIYDAVKVFYEAVQKINISDTFTLSTQTLSCDSYETWISGATLLNFMKTNKISGITKTLAFDGLGERDEVTWDILELTPAGNQTIGQFVDNKLIIDRPIITITEDSEDSIMKNKSFLVLVGVAPPFTYTRESATKLTGNDQYEGFAVDLIEALSKMLAFNYELKVEKKTANMVEDLEEDRAHFAICDFTITVDRQKRIDFSTPFMSVGIGIIFKEPSKQPPAMFSFMEVFDKEVWLWMLFIQMGIGVIMIFVGRISNKEWQNPVPCVEQPEELSNQFSFANSIWLIIGSVMQQGSEIAPIALAPRMITSIWWFFTMVMVASYVGTLVAFLTVERNVLPFQTIEELASLKSVSYGVVAKGSTETFFKNANGDVYQKLYRNMKRVESNDEGIEMAENSTFAFFSESSAIDYYRHRHCDLLQVGGLLDSKSYGIGMKKESLFKPFIDDALLKLKENGELQKMQDSWWKEKRGGGKCGEKKEEAPLQLSMKNMTGAFVVLGGGCLFGILISIIDMLWWLFKRSIKYNTTFKYELVEELKFALKFQGDVKPVKRPNKTVGDEEALADADAADVPKDELADELGSLRSARTVKSGRSGRSTSTSDGKWTPTSDHQLPLAKQIVADAGKKNNIYIIK